MVLGDDGVRDSPHSGEARVSDSSRIDRFVGERLCRLRQGLGLAPRQFAERIGVTRHLLLRYEDGRRPVPAAVLVRAAIVCDCPPASFFPGDADTGEPSSRFAEDEETLRLVDLFESCPAPIRRRILAFARAASQA